MVDWSSLTSPTAVILRSPVVEKGLPGPGGQCVSRHWEAMTEEPARTSIRQAVFEHSRMSRLLALMSAVWIRMLPLSASSSSRLLASVLMIETPGPVTLMALASTIQLLTWGVTGNLTVRMQFLLLYPS